MKGAPRAPECMYTCQPCQTRCNVAHEVYKERDQDQGKHVGNKNTHELEEVMHVTRTQEVDGKHKRGSVQSEWREWCVAPAVGVGVGVAAREALAAG